MDLHSYPRGENGRLEQILNQFFLKSLHVILDSRVPAIRPSSRYGEVKKSDKWFNLVLGDRPSAMDNLSFWNRSFMEPMVIDIILVQESLKSSLEHSSITTLGSEMVTDTVIERWVVQHEHRRSVGHSISEASYKKTYKKSILLLRSIYSMLRLLPAYKAFRKRGSSQNCVFDINYKVCTYAVPFSREEDELMKRHNFIPIDTKQGALSVSLTYRKDLSDFIQDAFVSFPSEIITDYVGSPLTEPIRPFPTYLSEKGVRATSFPITGSQPTSSSALLRRHSWASGIHEDASQKNQPYSGSPPLYRSPYEHSSSPTDLYGHRFQNQRSPACQKAAIDDLLSPPFSPSPSPSPPTYLYSGNPLHSRMRSETPPMSIPHPMMGRSPRYLSPNLSDPNRHSLPPLSPRSTKNDPSSQESSSGIRSIRKSDSLRTGEPSPGLTNLGPRVSRDSKEDSGRFSGPLSSSSSPRVGFSRSSSRLSFQDDFGDGDFTYPFIVDDVDPPDFQSSQNLDGKNKSEDSSQASSTAKRSQDAAVGVLVHMLRTAPPLRPTSSYTSQSSENEVEREVGTASEFFKPRDTTDALEELKAYKEMRDQLVSKSAARTSIREKD
ncbi:autophagy-related protein 13a-like [Olea europaea var. sylvestris]|uniref:autophagy-related protein 13a-like n=1 Tax=Olea europaea var. sylvestris TaxID=158386 RepID=UPI000C1D4DAC|nr:autophagy-related protein 13a-like [Olea europaea var. sylvestris]